MQQEISSLEAALLNSREEASRCASLQASLQKAVRSFAPIIQILISNHQKLVAITAIRIGNDSPHGILDLRQVLQHESVQEVLDTLSTL